MDSDCDGSIMDDYEDLDDDETLDCIDPDGDGVEAGTDCDDRDATAYGAPESCDFTDSDCDGSLADEFEDADGDDEPDCIDGDWMTAWPTRGKTPMALIPTIPPMGAATLMETGASEFPRAPTPPHTTDRERHRCTHRWTGPRSTRFPSH